MKTLRIKLAHEQKARALVSAARYETTLGGVQGVLSATKAGQHTADGGRLFFYVTVEDDVQQVVTESATNIGAEVEELDALPQIDECLNCGNVADKSLAVCPNCHFREIAACPHCGNDVARVAYVEVAADLFSCPVCRTHVRLDYADPLFDEHGRYNEPPVRVEEAG